MTHHARLSASVLQEIKTTGWHHVYSHLTHRPFPLLLSPLCRQRLQILIAWFSLCVCSLSCDTTQLTVNHRAIGLLVETRLPRSPFWNTAGLVEAVASLLLPIAETLPLSASSSLSLFASFIYASLPFLCFRFPLKCQVSSRTRHSPISLTRFVLSFCLPVYLSDRKILLQPLLYFFFVFFHFFHVFFFLNFPPMKLWMLTP